MSTISEPGSAQPEQRLAKGALSTLDAIVISVSVLAPGMAMFLNVPGVAAVAGGSTPLAFLLGGIACLALAFVVIGFTRRMAAAGYAYTYASRSLGKSAGFMAGWLYAFGLICFVPMTMAGVAYLAVDLLKLDSGWWFPIFLVGMALLVVLSIIRIKVTTKVQLIIGILTVALIVIVDLVVTAKGGAHGNSLQPFSFAHTNKGGFSGVFYGIILGITSYIGFETAADFGEETANPRRAIPIAVLASVGFAIVFYLWTTYSLTIGFGDGAKFGSDPSALKTIADKFVGGPVPQLLEIGAMLSAFVVCVGCATAGTRTLFAMGREGVLPAWLGQDPPDVPDAGQRDAGRRRRQHGARGVRRVRHGPGRAGRPADHRLLLLRDARHAAGHRRLHRAVPRWCGLLQADPQVVQPADPPASSRSSVRCCSRAALYGSIYPTPPHPLNYTPYITLIWIVLGLVVLVDAALAPAGGRAADRLDPRRGGRRRGGPRPGRRQDLTSAATQPPGLVR